VFVEMVSESALITKRQIGSYSADLGIFMLKGITGGLNAEFHDEGLWAAPEGLDKLSVQLTRTEMHMRSQLLHTDSGAEVIANVCQCFFDVLAGMDDGHGLSIALSSAHESNDLTAFITNRHFVRDEPVGDTLRIKKKLNDVQPCPAGAQDFFIITAKVFRQTLGKKIKVIFTDNFNLLPQAQAFEEMTIGTDDLETAVFGKERDARQMIKDLIELTIGSQRPKELTAKLKRVCRFHGDRN